MVRVELSAQAVSSFFIIFLLFKFYLIKTNQNTNVTEDKRSVLESHSYDLCHFGARYSLFFRSFAFTSVKRGRAGGGDGSSNTQCCKHIYFLILVHLGTLKSWT